MTLFTKRILLYAVQDEEESSGRPVHWIKILDRQNKKLYEQRLPALVEPQFKVG